MISPEGIKESGCLFCWGWLFFSTGQAFIFFFNFLLVATDSELGILYESLIFMLEVLCLRFDFLAKHTIHSEHNLYLSHTYD